MFKQDIKYTDYNGVEREETFYFHLNKAEMLELQLSKEGGFEKYLEDIINAEDTAALISVFKELILKAYGVKSEDGKRFIKNDAIRECFSQTEAFSEMFMALATDDNKAAEFINGIFPQDQRLSDAELKKAKIDAENRAKTLAMNNEDATPSEKVVEDTTLIENAEDVAIGMAKE